MSPTPLPVETPKSLVPRGFRLAFERLVPPVFLGALPLGLLVWVVIAARRDDLLAVDFHHELYPQSAIVLEGTNPYPPVDADLSGGKNPIWPIAAALLVAPLTALPADAADWVMTALVIGSFVGALLVTGVRDWRVFGATLMWPSVINGIQTGNLTLPLCLLVAVFWRYRRHTWVAGSALGLALALKLFLWPLLPWLAARRRPGVAVVAAGIGAGSLLLILPFTGIDDYVLLLRNLSDTFDGLSYTLYALLIDAHLADILARVVWLVAGVAVLALAIRRGSFALAVGAALALSTIVWLHFFALLAVPLAVVRPRFSPIWLLPLVMWLAPGTYNGDQWQTAVVLAAGAATIAWCALTETGLASRGTPISTEAYARGAPSPSPR